MYPAIIVRALQHKICPCGMISMVGGCLYTAAMHAARQRQHHFVHVHCKVSHHASWQSLDPRCLVQVQKVLEAWQLRSRMLTGA